MANVSRGAASDKNHYRYLGRLLVPLISFNCARVTARMGRSESRTAPRQAYLSVSSTSPQRMSAAFPGPWLRTLYMARTSIHIHGPHPRARVE
jgi:hypothetical protein